MASVEKQPQPESKDQQPSPPESLEQSQTIASRNFLDEVRQSSSDTATGRNDGANGDSRENGYEDLSTGEKPQSVSERMLNEIWKTTSDSINGVSKMISKGISPDLAEKFGSLSLFDGEKQESEGGLEAATQGAQSEQFERAESKRQPESSQSETGVSGLGEALSDLGTWAADAFNDYVTEPLNDYLNISDIFGSASEWKFDSSNLVPRNELDTDVTSLNNRARGEFSETVEEVSRAENREIDLDGATDAGAANPGGNGLELPGDAYADGSVEIGGSTVTVMRTPAGDTFLKKGDEVIAQQRDDGSYNLALNDGSRLDLKMSRDADGKYSLDKMERFDSDNNLMQKLDDQVFYDYNYDGQGNRTSVNAAASLDGPLSQERLDRIRAELGDRGAAALRIHNTDGTVNRLLLQSHDSKTHSLTDIDKRNAQIFHDGKEYRLNAADQLALVGPDGKEENVAGETDEAKRNVQEHLKELYRQLSERAHGKRDEVDGVGIRSNADGSVEITMTDPATGTQEGRIILPADKNDDLSLIKANGETARIKREGGLSIENGDGDQLFDFDPSSGLTTDKFSLDDTGLKNLQDGSRLSPDGTLSDANGNTISSVTEAGTEWWNKPECADCEEQAENNSLSKSTTSEVNTLGSISLSISRSGSPAAITVAKSIAAEAFGVANAALSALGNDLLNSIPIQLSLSVAQTAFNQAARSERTTTYASRLGISDATRLSEFNKIGTLSSTSFSPEEFVRDRLKAA